MAVPRAGSFPQLRARQIHPTGTRLGPGLGKAPFHTLWQLPWCQQHPIWAVGSQVGAVGSTQAPVAP